MIYTFTSLPPELRLMVYSLLLEDSQPHNIRSPSKTRGNGSYLRKATAANLSKFRLMNKLIHHESSVHYYSHNTFIVGNGLYGSSWESNSHGLKRFVRTIPSAYISCIRSVVLGIAILPPQCDYGSYLGERATFGKHDAVELQSICRTLVRYFTSTETIQLKLYNVQNENIYHADEYPAPLAVKKAITILHRLPQLKLVIFPASDNTRRADIHSQFVKIYEAICETLGSHSFERLSPTERFKLNIYQADIDRGAIVMALARTIKGSTR